MKKISICFAIILAFASTVQAQKLNKGYKGYVDAGYFIENTDVDFNRFEIGLSHGYQFNSHLFLGGGIGFHFSPSCASNKWENYLDTRNSKVDIPLFIDFRAHFTKRRIAPFIGLKGGIYISDSGPYLNISTGLRYALNRKSGLTLSIGYTAEELEFDRLNIRDKSTGSTQYQIEGAVIKLGFDF